MGGARRSTWSGSWANAPPTIVLVITDDQRADTLWAMPLVRSQLVERGVKFTNAFVVNPLCCPSRASILTGKYSHSTGVWRNTFPHGGFSSFDDSVTLATALHDVGYRTALVGKYLNGYGAAARATGYIPPGWDRWVAFAGSHYFNYQLNIDGQLRSFGDGRFDYSTGVLVRAAKSFIRANPGPLFLYFAPYAPHGPAIPARRHAGTFPNLPPARPPNFDEADVSDKPQFIRRLARLGPTERDRIDAFRRRQLQTLQAVDEAVRGIVRALADARWLSRSVIIFTSDNGLALGEHRRRDKQTAYEETARVPFVVRADQVVPRRAEVGRFALNIDIAPTIKDLTGASMTGIDGRSLVPLLEGRTKPWRRYFLIEHLNDPARPTVPSYCAVRSSRHLLANYATGEREMYDLQQDPFELASRVTDPPLATLQAELDKRCVPPPPGSSLP